MPFKDKQKHRDYMVKYMQEYRKREREAIRDARRLLGLDTRIRRTQRRRKK